MPTGYYAVKDRIRERLAEPAPGRVQILTGPRQVGKTTMLLELARGLGESALYLAADAPQAALSGWWEAQWERAIRLARTRKAALLIDEVQYLPHWARLIKSGFDQVQREDIPLHIVITGSAALDVGAGVRETMAGRFEKTVLSQWSPRDMAKAFDLQRDDAIDFYVRFGSFPGGIGFLSDLPRWRSYIRDSIVEPAIGRDLLMLEPVRKPALVRQVFAVCTGHPAEIMSLGKIAGAVSDRGTLETIAHYLQLLEQAYLISTIRKHSSRELRRRASPPKLIVLNNAFLASAAQQDPPTHASSPELWGRWVENACLAFAIANDQSVAYWREEPLEVDAVISGSWGKWAVEVKTGPCTARDLAGLLEFCRRWPDYRPLVVCEEEHADSVTRIGSETVTWRQFLWDGVASVE